MFSFYVVPGNRQPLVGMPDIKTLAILTINCNTIESKEADGSKFEIEDKPVVNDSNNNSIRNFIPGPNSDANRKGKW